MSDNHQREQAERRVGTTVAGKYRLLSVLGVGGMGAVYRSKHVITGAFVALKVLLPQYAHNGEIVARFFAEARAAAEIGHEAVVKVHDAGEDAANGEVYIAMEMLDGEDVASAIERRTIDLHRLVAIAIELLDILRVAHDVGIIHRDIKPENVFLARRPDGSQQVKLLDFGIARFVSAEAPSMTRTGAVLGTPLYMSPEQAVGDKTLGPRSDLWSVGALLFHALADRPPFNADHPQAVLALIITSDAPSIAQFCPMLPRALVDVVDRALQRDPQKRWQSALSMSRALHDALEALPKKRLPINSTFRKQATRLDWSASPSRTLRGTSTRGMIALGVLVVVVGFTGGLLSQWKRAPQAHLASTNAGDARVHRAIEPPPTAVLAAPPPAPTVGPATPSPNDRTAIQRTRRGRPSRLGTTRGGVPAPTTPAPVHDTPSIAAAPEPSWVTALQPTSPPSRSTSIAPSPAPAPTPARGPREWREGE